VVLDSPVAGDRRAARSESSVLYPYTGPAAKSASSPSVSGTTTVSPASSAGAIRTDSACGISPPVPTPPEIAYEGSSSVLRLS